MRKIIKSSTVLALLLTATAITPWAYAQNRNFAGVVDLERGLEDRIKPLAARFDPDAIVRVNVSFQKISSPLPGTAMDVKDYTGSSDAGTLRDAEVSSVTVTLFTTKDKIPSWLTDGIDHIVPGVKPRIERKSLSPDAREPASMPNAKGLDPTKAILDAVNTLVEQARHFSLLVFAGLGAILLVGFAIGTFVAFALQKKRSAETSRLFESRLIPALQNIGQGADSGGSASRPTVLQATLTAPAGGFQGSGGSNSDGSSSAMSGVAGLSVEALEAVLADCYWCQQDTYAAWLWSAMTPEQREKIFTSQNVDRPYLRWVQSHRREKLEEHFNPVYLNPVPVHHVSQTDMARWVEKNPFGFHALSPMRQKTLPISLKTRLSCAAEILDEKRKAPDFPDRASVRRILPSAQQFGELTTEDETTLLHNPQLVDEAIRPQIRSLVWLALKPLEFRQKALAEYSAETLAAAWIGAEEVLARLAEGLPEKKRQMLEGYLKFTELNRKTSVFGKLIDLGLDPRTQYATETPSARPGSKAA